MAAAVVVGVVVLGSVGCTSTSDDAASSTSDTGSATTVLPSPTAAGTEPTSSTTDAVPPPASVLPPPVTDPGAPVTATTCAVLADVLPIGDLIPRDGDSWPDERQRVVVDARRDAALYAQAVGTAPPALSAPLVALGDFTTFVADTVQSAGDPASARAAIDAYPAQGEVGAASSEVDRWSRTNCS